MKYDILGRVKRQSVPTEVDANFDPAGDDQTRGWLWTHQRYDWMGRVVRRIATDGDPNAGSNDSDVLISYAGCGCAGGLETTIQGEEIIEKDWNGSNPVSLGRRTQKIYEDILGRAWKTEVLNWNSSVYLTTETAYDGRDQALTVTQTEASTSVSQVTSMTYDGHGRLKTLHSPRQDVNKSTVYNYNPDDSISDVTDARGAKMRYQYNNRGLVDTIDSILPEPSEIPAAPAVGFEYDTVGNRTLMTDGLGTVNYEYDSLSRLTAETRAFTDNLANAPAGGVYRLEYTYEIGGRLRSYKDPYGQQFYFANDKAGRGLSVTGNTAFAGVTGYVSSAKYRAWGGLKELHTGDGMRSETDYNNRLRPYSFKLKRPDNSLVMDKTYDYYADESLRRVDDLLQNKFDRLNKYDHIGNIRESKAGTLARGEISSHYEDRPYTQLYSFDTFGRFRGRSGSYWNTTYTYSYTYVNDRVTAYTTTGASNPSLVWQYDADGREIVSYTDFFRRGDQVYDAAGNLTKVIDYALTGNTPISEVQRYYDGDGREGKRTSRVFNTSTNTWEERPARYFVVSSVFDGETVSKTDETGRKLETNVFAGGRMVARQLVYYGTLTGDLYQVEWKNQDNFGLSDLRTRKRHDSDTVTGDSFAPLELDAAGTELLSLLPEGGGIDPDLPMEQNQGDVWQTANDPNYYNRGLGGAASPACAVGSFLIDCSRVRFADGIGNGVFGSLERAQRESARQIGARFRVRELVAASPSGPPVLRSGGSRPSSQRISSDGESILIGYEWWLEPIFNDSWSVISQRDGPLSPSQLRKQIVEKFGEKITKCLKDALIEWANRQRSRSRKERDHFVETVKKWEPDHSKYFIDARLTSAQLEKRFNTGYIIGGKFVSQQPYAIPDISTTPNPTIRYGREFWNDPNQWKDGSPNLPGRSPIENAYVHEVGNIVSKRLTGSFYSFGNENASDPDSGYAIQICVFGN
ncbi:MAG: RHS repeat protein [Acidobacteria bacterium]|nr:RHS repeat protein [Acidobacteriota bacterium]